MKSNKSTTEDFKRELFAPIIKDSKGTYLAVLSDDSLDRDGERVGKSALEKLDQDEGYLAALIDHKNEALGQVAQWVNRRVEKVGDNTLLVAEAKFFKSNPKAMQIKGMLDEGAEFGVSIGAIVKEWEDLKFQGETVRTFTKLELLEASFCAIPSNRHGKAMAVAKSYKNKTKKEDIKMSDMEFTQKDMDSAIEKGAEEYKSKISELEKSAESHEKKVSELTKSLEDANKIVETNGELSKKLEEANKIVETKKEVEGNLEKSNNKIEQLEKDLVKAKSTAIEKQSFFENGSTDKVLNEEGVAKEIEAGKLPFVKY